MSKLLPTLFLPLAVLCLPACAVQETPPAPGMVVVRDAQTGALRAPTAAEIRALKAGAAAGLAGQAQPAQPTVTTGPGGRRSVRLDERHMVYSVVQREGDGKLAEHCVKGAAAAAAAAEAGPGAAPAASTPHQEHRHDRR